MKVSLYVAVLTALISFAAAQDTQLGMMTIYEALAQSDLASTLVAAIDAAGLADALSGTDPLTIFAPTNAAFEAAGITELPSAEELTPILLYHVVDGAATSSDLTDGPILTLEGSYLNIDIKPKKGTVLISSGITKGKVVSESFDIVVNNGIIHFVDTVFLPTSDIPCLEVVAQNPNLSTLNTLLANVPGIEAGISAFGEFTLLSPTNGAFSKFEGEADFNTLAFHVLQGVTLLDDFEDGSITTVLQSTVNVVVKPKKGVVRINDVKIRRANIVCDGGVIHIMKKVLTSS